MLPFCLLAIGNILIADLEYFNSASCASSICISCMHYQPHPPFSAFSRS